MPACCKVRKTGGRSAKYNLESNLPISEGSDDQSWSVTKVLITILELSITDVSKAMTLALIPPEEERVEEKKEEEGKVGRQRRSEESRHMVDGTKKGVWNKNYITAIKTIFLWL